MGIWSRTRTFRNVLLVTGMVVAATSCEDKTTTTTAATVATTSTSTTTTTTIAVDDSSCAGGGACALGETGPGGGVVIYVKSSGTFPCGVDLKSACNSLEAAPDKWASNLSGFEGCSAYTENDPLCALVPSTLKDFVKTRDLGAAQHNTASLVNAGAMEQAPGMVQAYNGGGKSDWGVPTYGDLVYLCTYFRGGSTSVKQLFGCTIGAGTPKISLVSAKYVSSSNYGSNVIKAVMTMDMNGGSRYGDNYYQGGQGATDGQYRVRPVRAFMSQVQATTTTVKATTTTVKATVTTVAAVVTTTTAAPATTTTVLTCAAGGSCAVGDTGPGGGTVYYVSPAGFSCGVTLSSTCHYLEVSPTSWKAATGATANCTAAGSNDVECVWATANASNYASTSGAVGQGAANTKAVIDSTGVLNAVAAVVAKAYQGGGKSDWFLPSQHEMDELCKFSRNQTTGNQSVACTNAGTLRLDFRAGNYWTSNDGGSGTAISVDLLHGTQAFPNKSLARLIRPIRAF